MAQKQYECMFLLDSSRFASDPDGTEEQIKEILGRVEAEIVASAPWQDGKLAYQVDGHRKGTHYLTYFRMDGSQVNEFERLCKLNDTILRQLLIRHDDQLFDPMSEALAQHASGEDGSGEEEE